MLNKDQITAAAQTIGLDYATVAAVSSVESSGNGFDASSKFPIILFEGHIFSKLTKGKYDQSNPTISYPIWTTKFYAGSQSGERKRLEQAVALDRDAALQSASWGLFQIMGMNYAYCGCSSIQDFVNKMCQSEQMQLQLFLKFIQSKNLIPYLKAHAWEKFASAYNGPAYKKNNYDVKLANAYLKFSKE